MPSNHATTSLIAPSSHSPSSSCSSSSSSSGSFSTPLEALRGRRNFSRTQKLPTGPKRFRSQPHNPSSFLGHRRYPNPQAVLGAGSELEEYSTLLSHENAVPASPTIHPVALEVGVGWPNAMATAPLRLLGGSVDHAESDVPPPLPAKRSQQQQQSQQQQRKIAEHLNQHILTQQQQASNRGSELPPKPSGVGGGAGDWIELSTTCSGSAPTPTAANAPRTSAPAPARRKASSSAAPTPPAASSASASSGPTGSGGDHLMLMTLAAQTTSKIKSCVSAELSSADDSTQPLIPRSEALLSDSPAATSMSSPKTCTSSIAGSPAHAPTPSASMKGPAPQPPGPPPGPAPTGPAGGPAAAAACAGPSSCADSSPIIVKQPQRSSSISRGLQVETDDLIQFSTSNKPPAPPLPHEYNNNNTSKKPPAPLPKRLRAPNKAPNTNSGADEVDPLDQDSTYEFADEYDFDERGDGADSPTSMSARTADEQMDYLESLEPCPCYAKCCIDSVITLFCVTLLG